MDMALIIIYLLLVSMAFLEGECAPKPKVDEVIRQSNSERGMFTFTSASAYLCTVHLYGI